MKRKKIIIWTLFVPILIFLSLIGIRAHYGKRTEAEKAKVSLKTGKVEKKDIVLKIEETGVIKPIIEVKVRSEISGRIRRIKVKGGSRVKRGSLLVELDKTDLNNQLKKIEILLEKTAVSLEKAKIDYQRSRGLFEKNFISAEEKDDSKTVYRLAQVEYKEGENEKKTIIDKLKKCEIISPILGTIIQKDVEEGEVVVGTGSAATPTPLFTIADLNQMLIKTEINEVDVMKLKLKQEAKITLDAFPDKSFRGIVSYIGPMAIEKDKIKVFEVEIRILGSDPVLKPGITANIEIIAKEKKDVFSVPVTALFKKKGKYLVYKVRDKKKGTYYSQEVKTGLSNFQDIEVVEGLEEGEEIYLEDPTKEKDREKEDKYAY